MSNRATTLCFSGHRYYPGAPADEARLFAALQTAYEDGYRTFISGVAEGFDLAAGEAVLRLRDGGDFGDAGIGTGCENAGHEDAGHNPRPDVRFVAAVPFARQSAKYSAADRARYDALLAAADQVRVLSERYSYGCYYRRDDWMVERSARIICWFDGASGGSCRGPAGSGNSRSSGGSASGTRYTVRRALSAGFEIVNLFREPDTLF